MGYDDTALELMTKAYDMKWSLTKKNNLLNHSVNDRYYTIDISVNDDRDTTGYASTYYTDLPGPHFDYDDNPEPIWSGYIDETEVTMTRPDLLIPGQAYQFISYWEALDTSGTTFEWNSQLSELSWTGEYNVVNYEDHFSKLFPWW